MTDAGWPVLAPRWRKLLWGVPLAVLVLLAGVFLVRWLRESGPLAAFITTYPGHTALPADSPTGFPAWLSWQHFLNAFFLVLIIRSGWQVRTTQRPTAYWTRNNTGFVRTKNPPGKVSLTLWFHLCMDVLWLVNGVVFVVLLFVSGHWIRIVPTSWDVLPNALSSFLQYISLDWPTENGWVNYNSLQLLAYFLTVFVVAPLAMLTGARMSGGWPANAKRLNRLFPIELARAVHFPVMLYFVFFVIVHVALVLSTGALRNLNHMYGGSNDINWLGFWVFAASIAVTAVGWVAARPLVLRPIASLMGKVSR